MSHSFKKKHRLLNKKDFQRVFDNRSKLSGKFIKIYYRAASSAKLGIIASSSYGKAHIRNLFKRRIREAFRHSFHLKPLELIVVPNPMAKSATYVEILGDLTLLVQNISEK